MTSIFSLICSHAVILIRWSCWQQSFLHRMPSARCLWFVNFANERPTDAKNLKMTCGHWNGICYQLKFNELCPPLLCMSKSPFRSSALQASLAIGRHSNGFVAVFISTFQIYAMLISLKNQLNSISISTVWTINRLYTVDFHISWYSAGFNRNCETEKYSACLLVVRRCSFVSLFILNWSNKKHQELFDGKLRDFILIFYFDFYLILSLFFIIFPLNTAFL